MLTDTKLKSIRLHPTPKKYFDRDGLFLRVTAAGGMYWQWRIRQPKETTVSYGSNPEVSLSEARRNHEIARAQRRAGKNPNEVKAATKHAEPKAPAFETAAREWFMLRKDEWSRSYSSKVIARLESDVFPYIGKMPVDAIKPTDVLPVLRRIEKRGALETAHRTLETCGQVFRHCVASGHVASDPTRDLKEALQRPVVRHMAAISDPGELAALLRAIDGYAGSEIVRAALKLTPMLMVRPGELRFAFWDEFDLDGGMWTIPAVRMKRERQGKLHGDPHFVPLPTQAVEALRELLPLTGPSGYVFRGERDHERAISENTINAALRRMGYDTRADVTAHGFRATARTLLDEVLGYQPEIIEAQLAHSVRDSLGRAYNRTTYIDQRRKMMQAWADYLDKLNTVAIRLFNSSLTTAGGDGYIDPACDSNGVLRELVS